MTIERSLLAFAPVVAARARRGHVDARLRLDGLRLPVLRGRSSRPSSPASPPRCAGLGCAEISIGDTIGVGQPEQVPEVVGAVAASVPVERDRAAPARHRRTGARERRRRPRPRACASSTRRPAAWAAARSPRALPGNLATEALVELPARARLRDGRRRRRGARGRRCGCAGAGAAGEGGPARPRRHARARLRRLPGRRRRLRRRAGAPAGMGRTVHARARPRWGQAPDAATADMRDMSSWEALWAPFPPGTEAWADAYRLGCVARRAHGARRRRPRPGAPARPRPTASTATPAAGPTRRRSPCSTSLRGRMRLAVVTNGTERAPAGEARRRRG